MTVFVQIGAGAGDRDARVNFRDGFTEFVKGLDKTSVSRIVLIEPNPLNIKDLMECWKDYPQAEIYNIAVVPSSHKAKVVYFYYTEKDAPNYQVASVFPEHIQKSYGKDVELKKICVGAMGVNELNAFLFSENEFIKLYAMDIEGLDSEILFDINFDLINCEYLSFEYINLGDKEKQVLKKLRDTNFIFDGRGIDVHGYDWLFRKDLEAKRD